MNKKLKTTVTGFVFHDNKLLLIHHKRDGRWFHVGGHAEENETPDEALRREVKEEVNLDIEFLEEFKHYEKLKAKGIFKDLDGFKELPCPFYIHVKEIPEKKCRKISYDFVCIAKEIENIKIQEDELNDYKWVTRKELEEFELWKPLKILALKAIDVYEEWLFNQK